jgi:phosphoribosylamine---glycine ligase
MMRFLGVTETCDLGALYLRLQQEGHAVKVAISDVSARGTMAGMVPPVEDWRAEIDWIRSAGADGVILFESVSEGFGALQDRLRAEGLQVIGGSGFGDRLENDRAFAQAVLADHGFPAGHVHEFTDAAEAEAFILARPKRYVLKFSGPGFASSDNYVGHCADGRDVRAMLRLRSSIGATFILMDFIEGIEMGVGAYFDGTRFLRPACLDWEHKRFFAGDMGELTGEMGTVATFERSAAFFDRTLGRLEHFLSGHHHVGYINLNTIVNADGIWPLEFTCRFGYPGFAVLTPLQQTPWSEVFRMMLGHSPHAFAARPGFSVGVLLTTPPFPYTRKQVDEPVGLPVLFEDDFADRDHENLHFGEVGMKDREIVTSGLYGWTMVVTGCGPTIRSAQRDAYARAGRIHIPNMRYRLDIGDRLLAGDFSLLEQMGYLGETCL